MGKFKSTLKLVFLFGIFCWQIGDRTVASVCCHNSQFVLNTAEHGSNFRLRWARNTEPAFLYNRKLVKMHSVETLCQIDAYRCAVHKFTFRFQWIMMPMSCAFLNFSICGSAMCKRFTHMSFFGSRKLEFSVCEIFRPEIVDDGIETCAC